MILQTLVGSMAWNKRGLKAKQRKAKLVICLITRLYGVLYTGVIMVTTRWGLKRLISVKALAHVNLLIEWPTKFVVYLDGQAYRAPPQKLTQARARMSSDVEFSLTPSVVLHPNKWLLLWKYKQISKRSLYFLFYLFIFLFYRISG